MKERETDVLYGNVTVTHPVPSNYEEGDKMVGITGGVLDGFNSDCVARNFLPRLYRETAKSFIERFPKKNNGTDDKPVVPTDIAYLGQLWDEHKDLRREIESTLMKKAREVPFYQSIQTSGGGKISQAAIDAANKFIAEGREVKSAEYIEDNVPGYTVQRGPDGKPTLEGLARGVQALQRHLKNIAIRQAEAKLEL
jgi:hypothetical protein